MLNNIEAFNDAMQAAGLRHHDEIIADGKIHRVTLEGDKPKSKNGWYLLHTDGVAAGAFGSWKHDMSGTWCAKSEHEFTPDERRAYTQRMEDTKRQREAEAEAMHAEAQAKAAAIWDAAEPANDEHPYLVRKGIKANGVRESQGSLVIPARSSDGTLQTLQFIDADGNKLFLKGGAKKGTYYRIGTGEPTDTILVAEGFSTGASLHESTGLTVAVAFDAGNLDPIVAFLTSRFPERTIRLCADNDVNTKGNPGMTKASAAAQKYGAEIVAPEAGDFNDMALADGPEAVAALVSKPANDNAVAVFTPADAMVVDWVFVSAQRKFIHKPTMRSVDVDAFNMEHLHLMAEFPQHRKMKPAEYLRRVQNSEVVHDLMYLPTMWNGDPLFFLDGIKYLNTYNETSIPPTDPNWQAHDAWQICLAHLKNIMPEDWEILLQWMAHNVQHPGKKILWAPVIVGMPGDGKTTIAKMLTAAMGRKHTQVVGMEGLRSDFNGWAEGKCLSTFEEIRVPGHSRHDFMNKLKTLITNDIVDVVAKGKNSRNVANTQNYIALSNFRDALVLDPDDRRWGVFFTRFDCREQVMAQMDKKYWADLNDYAIRDYPSVIRGWLLNVDITGFDRNEGPAMTTAKRYMINHSMSADAQTIDAVLTTGAKGVSLNVVETRALNHAVRDLENRTIQTSRMSVALSELKFEKLKDTIKWDGRACHVWVRKPFDYDGTADAKARIRDELDANAGSSPFFNQNRYSPVGAGGAF